MFHFFFLPFNLNRDLWMSICRSMLPKPLNPRNTHARSAQRSSPCIICSKNTWDRSTNPDLGKLTIYQYGVKDYRDWHCRHLRCWWKKLLFGIEVFDIWNDSLILLCVSLMILSIFQNVNLFSLIPICPANDIIQYKKELLKVGGLWSFVMKICIA